MLNKCIITIIIRCIHRNLGRMGGPGRLRSHMSYLFCIAFDISFENSGGETESFKKKM